MCIRDRRDDEEDHRQQRVDASARRQLEVAQQHGVVAQRAAGADIAAAAHVFESGVAAVLAERVNVLVAIALVQAVVFVAALKHEQAADPLAPKAQHYLGVCRLQQKKFDDAVAAFKVVIEKYPKVDLLDQTYLNLGLAQYSQAQGGKAEAFDQVAQASCVAGADAGRGPCDGGGGGVHESVDLSSDGSFQAAFDVAGTLAVMGPAGGVGLGGFMDPESAEGDGVKGAVELAVAGSVQSVAGDFSTAGGERGCAGAGVSQPIGSTCSVGRWMARPSAMAGWSSCPKARRPPKSSPTKNRPRPQTATTTPVSYTHLTLPTSDLV